MINKMKLSSFDHFQKLLLCLMTLATSVEKILYDILSQERVIVRLETS